MAHDPHHPDASHHGPGHVVSPKILISTALALLVLTGITVATAKMDFSKFDLNELNVFVALFIAVVKGSLVCLFFMHLRWDRPFNGLVLVTSLSLVGLFISFAMTDSSEYKPEIIPGNSAVIEAKLAEVPPAPPASAPAPEGSAPAGH
jgi:cytochrome c oxidase subunit 4